jgi:hypothetical protein
MPIRLNLLAEAQAAEELRRKDPVKRAMIFGALCVALMAVASVVIQSDVIRTDAKAKGFAREIQAITNDYAEVMGDYNKLQQLNLNVRGLNILASERFLEGSLLNALQKVYVDNVQLIHLRTEFNYTVTDEAKSKSADKKVLKPATSAENITLVLEARDASPNPGDQVNKFKEALGKNNYLSNLIGTNNELRLVSLSPPQVWQETGRPVVQFTLQSQLPEKVRLPITSSTRYAPSTGKAKLVAKKTTAED